MRRSLASLSVGLVVFASVAPVVAASPDEPADTTSTPASPAPTTSAPVTTPTPAATTTTVPTTVPTTTVPPTSAPTTSVAPTTTPTTTTVPTTSTTAVETPPTSAPTTTTVAPTPPPPADSMQLIVPDERVGYILATIRYLESRDTYDAPPNKGGASGAYQYITSSWANYAGYPEAYLAPPWVQDERALADVLAILRRYDNNVAMVPVSWYFPAAIRNPELMDTVPKPEKGNVLTIREYQLRWLDTFMFLSGMPLSPREYPLPPGLELLSGIPPVPTPAADGVGPAMAFPLLGPAVVAPPTPCEGDGCTPEPEDAIIFGRTLQPVLAAADGVVTEVHLGDDLDPAVRVTITDVAGRSFRYAGLNDDSPDTDDGAAPPALQVTALAKLGRTVRAGQVIGFLGDSDPIPVDPAAEPGSPVWPHLRLTVTDADGTRLDAVAGVTRALFSQTCTTGIGQWSVPPNASVFDHPIGEVLVPSDDGGAWRITPSGQVQAIGVAALIAPREGCQWSPPNFYGPDAGGNDTVPEGFGDSIRLPIDVWLAISNRRPSLVVSTPFRRG